MIWRHLLGYLPANMVGGLVSFGIVFLFTRVLGADDYGRYALVFAGMQLTHTLILTWAEAATYRHTQEAVAKDALPDHIRTCLAHNVISSIPALFVVSLAWTLIPDPKMKSAIAWLVLCMPAMTLLQTALELRRALQHVQRFSLLFMARALSALGLGVMIALRTDAGAAAPFMGLGIATSLIAAMEVIALLRMSKGGKVDTARYKTYFPYGAPIAIAVSLELALSAGDRFMIAAFIDEAAVGAYAAGYGVADQTIRLLCMWAAMASAPHLLAAWERNGAEGLKEPGLGMARMMLLITLPAAVGIALVARPLAEFMVGEQLRSAAAHIMPWIAVAGLLNGWMVYYYGEAFVIAKRTGLRALVMITPLILNIILNFILLPRIGLMGAVYATVASYAIAVLLSAIVGGRYAPLPFPLMDALKTGAACLVMAGATLLVPAWGGFLELAVKAGLGAIAYGVTAYLLNAAGARHLINEMRAESAAPPDAA